jgi:hypothetical protein
MLIFLSAYLFPKSHGDEGKNVKTFQQPQSKSFNSYPTPYNSAHQDLKIDISIKDKINSAVLVIYTSDKKEIKRISIGALEKGNYSKRFDRTEFKGIESGTYYFRIMDSSDVNGDNQDHKLFYIIR